MNHVRRHANHSAKNFLKNTVSAQLHLAAVFAAFVGMIVLVHYASISHDSTHVMACLIFGVTSILVFTSSTLYHFLSDGFDISASLRQFVKDLDHSSIFLFIAGTYTPFILKVISPPWDQILMLVVWVTGFTGVAYVFLRRHLPAWARNRFIYTGIFLAMGWALVLRIGEAVDKMSTLSTFLLIAGGLSYSIGAVIYATKWPNPIQKTFGFHEIWHVMVIFGFAFHYFLILGFYL